MQFLKSHMRPVEVFNVQNRKHRELFAEFLRTNSWTHSPVRFVASEPTQVDVGTIQRQMLEFYTSKEFGSKATNRRVAGIQQLVQPKELDTE